MQTFCNKFSIIFVLILCLTHLLNTQQRYKKFFEYASKLQFIFNLFFDYFKSMFVPHLTTQQR